MVPAKPGKKWNIRRDGVISSAPSSSFLRLLIYIGVLNETDRTVSYSVAQRAAAISGTVFERARRAGEVVPFIQFSSFPHFLIPNVIKCLRSVGIFAFFMAPNILLFLPPPLAAAAPCVTARRSDNLLPSARPLNTCTAYNARYILCPSALSSIAYRHGAKDNQ